MQRARSSPSQNANHKGGVEFLHAAAQACPHGLMIEEDGIVQYANWAYARLAGLASAAAIVGRVVGTMAVPVPCMRKKSRGAAPVYDTLRFEFPHGRRRIRLHVVRDVTERRALEARLLESEKMEAVGRLVGGVAHDFNNILTAITLHSDLLRDRLGDSSAEVAEIRQAAQRGADLVRQLLTLARQQPATPQAVSLSKVIGSMDAVIQPLVGEDVELIKEFSAERDCVLADPAQLQQVILNLVMNARDALPGRIVIRTSEMRLRGRTAARLGLRDGNYGCLEVADNGCGMKDEVRARMFEPFFTTKQLGSGTGLGMSMIYGIVKQAGGAVSVASKLGKGTRVMVWLPESAQPTTEADAENTETRRGHETVLVADDDGAVRDSIATLLADSGYRVLQASDGRQALRAARSYKSPIHLLLTDVVMPRINGVDAAAGVRQLHPETKVLFMSGYPAKAASGALAGTLLFKPFSRTTLEQKVRATLEERLPVRQGSARPRAVRGTS